MNYLVCPFHPGLEVTFFFLKESTVLLLITGITVVLYINPHPSILTLILLFKFLKLGFVQGYISPYSLKLGNCELVT